MDVEKLHILLLDAKLPSTIHDLKNPTEEFIVNLFENFLMCFKIDVDKINKPTSDQQEALTCFEDKDIIVIINLYITMRQICDQIFLPHFFISDITNPGPKKICKFARYLANFILYAINKESDLEDIIAQIHSRGKLLEELQEKKMENLTLKNEKAIYMGKQLSLKEKYEMEIEKIQSLLASNEKRKIELQEEEITKEENRQKIVYDHNAYKLEVQKLDKAIVDLKSEIVNSPEKYKTRLYNLEEQKKAKIEEREKLQETYLAKDQLVKKYENILSFVKKQYEKFPEIEDTYRHLKEVNDQRENVKKQVDTAKNTVTELIKKCGIQDNKGTTINEIHALHENHKIHEERLTALCEVHAQLLSNKKSEAIKLEEDKVLYNNLYMEKNTIQANSKKIEGDTSIFIKNCEELYNNEVLKVINLPVILENTWE